MSTQTLMPGGGFLLAETDPHDIHTPEELTDEQRLLVNTLRDFVTQEGLPRSTLVQLLVNRQTAISTPKPR